MLAALSCDPNAWLFDGICHAIEPHDPTGVAGPVLERALGAIVVFAAVYIGGRLVRRLLDRAVSRAGGDAQVHALVRNVGAALIYLFAILSALVTAGLNPAFLLTFGGLASLAIGLAFQDLLRNVLAGIWLLLERPFRIGDLITVADCVGTVQTITLRTTALRTGDGRLAILPNLTAFNGVVVNSSAYDKRRYVIGMRVDGGRDLESVLRAARRELELTREIAKQPAPSVQPQLDAEDVCVQCTYWLEYRSHDPDNVAADLARRLWGISREDMAPTPTQN